MKKSIVIIVAIALIGAVGVMAKGRDDGASLNAPAGMMQSSAGQNSQQAALGSSTSNSMMHSSGSFKDGTFTGASEDTPYGTVQVAAVVSGGKITDIRFIRMPGPEGHSKEVTAFSEPYLKQETLQSQNSNIQFISGATTTSEAYSMSLQAALDQAAVS